MRMHLDPVACAGYGVCHQILPDHIQLDEWGFPIMGSRADVDAAVTGFERDRRDVEIPDSLDHIARRAVYSCPALALKLTQ